MSKAVELQDGIFNALDADAALSALVVAIYDNPLEVEDPGDRNEFPFLTIGDTIIEPWNSDTERGTEATVTIHTWARSHAFRPVKQIQQAIYNVMDRGTIVISGAVFIASDSISQDAQRDPDGITIHGTQQFRIIYDEVN